VRALRRNVSIIIKGDRIASVVEGTVKPTPEMPETLSVMGTCMPGLIDAHTHVLLQEDITAAQYDEQILKESIPFRTLRAARSARLALQYGFTALRDMETEGAGYADVDLKKAINQGIIEGPRMQTSGRAMDVTGAYPVLGYAWELQPHLPRGVQEVDGVEGARKATREQLSYGVDWIKVYSDRSYKLRPDGVLDDVPTFTVDELKAITDEAHRQRHKVASHATALNGVHNSATAGVDSIEHGDYISDEDLATMKTKGIYFVPTPFVGEYVAEGRGGEWPKMVAVSEETIKRAMKAGVKIAFGTDIGGFSWDITPAVQFKIFTKLGMTPRQALMTSTITAAELMGMQNEIGTLEPNKFADIVVVNGNPLEDVTLLERKVVTVVKGGVVVKK
jgi:imidazolonepropionase-like amidohydrolase